MINYDTSVYCYKKGVMSGNVNIQIIWGSPDIYLCRKQHDKIACHKSSIMKKTEEKLHLRSSLDKLVIFLIIQLILSWFS